MEDLHVVSNIIEKATEYSRSLVLLKLDIAEAFDRLRHDAIAKALFHFGVPEPLVAAFLRELCSGRIQIRTPDGLLTEPIDLQRGVRHGGCSSPFFFVVTLAILLLPATDAWAREHQGFVLDDLLVSLVCFADHIVIVAQHVVMAISMLLKLISALSGAGLTVQPQKPCWCGNSGIDEEHEISLDGTCFAAHASRRG